jgi:hypothetical protein
MAPHVSTAHRAPVRCDGGHRSADLGPGRHYAGQGSAFWCPGQLRPMPDAYVHPARTQSFWSGFPRWPCGLQIAPNSLIHNSQFLIRFASFLSDFNLDVGLLISGSKVRALVRPPSKYLRLSQFAADRCFPETPIGKRMGGAERRSIAFCCAASSLLLRSDTRWRQRLLTQNNIRGLLRHHNGRRIGVAGRHERHH